MTLTKHITKSLAPVSHAFYSSGDHNNDTYPRRRNDTSRTKTTKPGPSESCQTSGIEYRPNSRPLVLSIPTQKDPRTATWPGCDTSPRIGAGAVRLGSSEEGSCCPDPQEDPKSRTPNSAVKYSWLWCRLWNPKVDPFLDPPRGLGRNAILGLRALCQATLLQLS